MSQIAKTGQTVNINILRNETVINANSKGRIANLFQNLVDSSIFFDQISQSTGTSTTNIISQNSITNLFSTLPVTYLTKSSFNIYSGGTRQNILNATVTGGTNLGTTGNAIFSAKNGRNLEFKKLAAGSNVTLTSSSTGITISSTGGGSSTPFAFVFSASAPSNTYVAWIDTSTTINQANPIRYYINNNWTPITDECDWWDNIGQIVSKGKPLVILFSGQSNVGSPPYTPQADPSYTGDVTVDKYVTLWQPDLAVWKVYNFADATTHATNTWTYPLGTVTDDQWGGAGANQLQTFGKLYAKRFSRSMRFVGTRRGGQVMSQWESGKTGRIELAAKVVSSGVEKVDAFIWIHGEAGWSDGNNASVFTNYRDSFMDLITYLRTQSWSSETMKVIAPSHALNSAAFTGGHNNVQLSGTNGNLDAEGTFRWLDTQDTPYSAWAPVAYQRLLQNAGSQDPYHLTTREHEWQGAAIFQAYLSLPNFRKGDRLYRSFYTNASNRLTSVQVSLPNTDSYNEIYIGGGSSTATFQRNFSVASIGYINAIQEIVRGTSANFIEWAIRAGNTSPNDLEDKLVIGQAGVTVPKNLVIAGTSTLGSDPSSALVFVNGGGTGNDMWIAHDASFPYGILYKSASSGVAEGQHSFALGDTRYLRLYWRSGNFSLPSLDLDADFRISTLGKSIWIKEGANARMGVVTLVGGSATVSNTTVTANSRIFLSIQSLGTVIVPKAIGVTAKVNGTSFTITSADATDTSVIAWEMKEGF
jgi:hypothetical protein